MRGVLGGLVLDDAEAERRKVDAGEHRLALSEHDRRQGEVQLIDQAGDLACSSAASIPSVTKMKVVPPSISIGSRG